MFNFDVKPEIEPFIEDEEYEADTSDLCYEAEDDEYTPIDSHSTVA